MDLRHGKFCDKKCGRRFKIFCFFAALSDEFVKKQTYEDYWLVAEILSSGDEGVGNQCTFVFVIIQSMRITVVYLGLVFNFRITRQFAAWQHSNDMDYLNILTRFLFSSSFLNLLNTYFFSRLPAPVSRNPLAKGLLSIFNCVICMKKVCNKLHIR